MSPHFCVWLGEDGRVNLVDDGVPIAIIVTGEKCGYPVDYASYVPSMQTFFLTGFDPIKSSEFTLQNGDDAIIRCIPSGHHGRAEYIQISVDGTGGCPCLSVDFETRSITKVDLKPVIIDGVERLGRERDGYIGIIEGNFYQVCVPTCVNLRATEIPEFDRLVLNYATRGYYKL